ncbi:MAG: hypothetical protein ACAH88_09755 [Roseimicrobium sp.]
MLNCHGGREPLHHTRGAPSASRLVQGQPFRTQPEHPGRLARDRRAQ